MRYFKNLVAGALCLVCLYGCWFVVIPTGAITRAIQGPRYCVDQYKKVGDRIKTAGGKEATITKIHGEDLKVCINPSHPILANVTFDEEKKPENYVESSSSMASPDKKQQEILATMSWTDPRTGLMWAKMDNGLDINWMNAKSYCENYRLSGYTDWRMPTQDEMDGLYVSGALKNEIKTTGHWCWTSKTRGSEAAYVSRNGIVFWGDQSSGKDARVLPVRFAK